MNSETPAPLQEPAAVELSQQPQSAKRRRHWSISVLRLVLIGYATILITLWVMEARLLFPGAYLSGDQRPRASVSQPWQYTAKDGSSITGQRLDRPGSTRTILFLHGNGVKAVWLDAWIARLSENLDANVFAAEYRGFQNSDVTPSESNLVADSLSAHDALCKHDHVAPGEVIVYGRSLGGGCAAAVASQRNTQILILDSSFDSAVSVAAGKYPIFPISLVMQNQFDSMERLRDYRGQLIQIHGTSDEIIPIEHAKRLHDSIPATSKSFIELQNIHHNDRIADTTLKEVSRLINHP